MREEYGGRRGRGEERREGSMVLGGRGEGREIEDQVGVRQGAGRGAG